MTVRREDHDISNSHQSQDEALCASAARCLNPGCVRALCQREGRTKTEVPQYNTFTQLKETSHSVTQERVMKVVALSIEINCHICYCFPYLVYIIITCVVCFISTKCLIS